MARPDPDEPPESIVLGQFAGLRNTVARERLAPSELQKALNVDIDDSGQVRRRRGYTLKLAGDCHSLCEIGGRTLVVKDGMLGQLNPDYSFTSYAATGADPLSYTHVDQTTYFTSRSASGKLTGNTVEGWGAVDDAGEWVSPVMTPTDTLGEVFGHQITAPPMATDLTYYSGRIYLLAGRYIWATELWMPDYVQRTRNFLQLGAEGTTIAAVADGLYVGCDDGLWFYKGDLSNGFRADRVLTARVVPGSVARISAADIHPLARERPVPEGEAVVFLTDDGICAGFDGGQVFNLTGGRVAFPRAERATVLCRDDAGVSSYLAVADSAGGPAANARIGDYVDADIVRAADR